MRLIDADKLTELCDIMSDKCCGVGKDVWNQFRTVVEWSPRVNAVPVIRCKDCKHYGEMLPNSDKRMICHKFALNFDNDFFCRDGERKEE